MKKTEGKCALCGQVRELTFEHIPPKAAFNSSPVKAVNKMDDMGNRERLPWETDGLPYRNLQKGMGEYSLCEECNNRTGSWYGTSYVEVSRIASCALNDYKKSDPHDPMALTMSEIYPLRFIKQVLSMFCSINSGNSHYDELREFVLSREKIGLDKSKYKLCMYFLDSSFQKLLGETVVGKTMIDGSFDIMVLSEIAINPLGFILYYNPTDKYPYSGFDITSCADYGYDELCTLTMPLIVHETNTVFPEDFRTKGEIIPPEQ